MNLKFFGHPSPAAHDHPSSSPAITRPVGSSDVGSGPDELQPAKPPRLAPYIAFFIAVFASMAAAAAAVASNNMPVMVVGLL